MTMRATMRSRLVEAVHTGFLGVTGSGKTHEAKRRVAQLLQRGFRVLVISPADEWTADSSRPGPCREAITLAQLKADPHKMFEPDLSLALYGFDPLRPQQLAAAVKLVARLQSRFQQHEGETPPPFVLVLDECGSYARHCLATLEGLATLGGQHLGITLWCIAQRPALVPITVRSQWTRLVLFHLEESADVAAVEERTHTPGMAVQLLALPATPNIKVRSYIEWTASSREPATSPASSQPSAPPANQPPPEREQSS